MPKSTEGRPTPVQSPLPDFDTLKDMAEQQPEQLEALRKRLVNELIASVPETRRRRLRGMQFQIDMTRRRAKTPLQCCVTLSRLMWTRLDDLNHALNGWQSSPGKPCESPSGEASSTGRPPGHAAGAALPSNVVMLFPGDSARPRGQ